MRRFDGHRRRIVRLIVGCKALREQPAQVGYRIPRSKVVAPRGGVNEIPAVREAPYLVSLSANETRPGSAKHLLNLFLEFIHDELPWKIRFRSALGSGLAPLGSSRANNDGRPASIASAGEDLSTLSPKDGQSCPAHPPLKCLAMAVDQRMVNEMETARRRLGT
jgi:hypothetical protein